MLERLEANRLRQMSERYRITKLLDDLEAALRAPRPPAADDARLAGHRARRARLGGGPARRARVQPRADPGCARRARRSLSAASSSAAELAKPSATTSSSSAALDPHPPALDDHEPVRDRPGVGATCERGLDQPEAQLGRADLAGGGADHADRRAGAPARHRARPRPARGGRRPRRPARPARGTGRRCAPPRPSRSRRRARASRCSPRAAAGGGRRRRTAPPARCRRWRRRRRRRSTRCGSPRRARRCSAPPSRRGPAPSSTMRRCSRACSAEGCSVAEPGWRRQQASGSATRITRPASPTPIHMIRSPIQRSDGSQPPARSSAQRRASPPGPMTVSCRSSAARGEYAIGRTVSSTRPSASISR